LDLRRRRLGLALHVGDPLLRVLQVVENLAVGRLADLGVNVMIY
jgi:hypothetical protein